MLILPKAQRDPIIIVLILKETERYLQQEVLYKPLPPPSSDLLQRNLDCHLLPTLLRIMSLKTTLRFSCSVNFSIMPAHAMFCCCYQKPSSDPLSLLVHFFSPQKMYGIDSVAFAIFVDYIRTWRVVDHLLSHPTEISHPPLLRILATKYRTCSELAMTQIRYKNDF